MKDESHEFAYVLMERVGRPKHVVEVGAFGSAHLMVLPFIYDQKCIIDLIEPNPDACHELRQVYGRFSNIKIWECAIGPAAGNTILLVPRALEGNPDAASSAYLAHLPGSPYTARAAAGRVEELSEIVVTTRSFDDVDDGTIDGLALDAEGAEWYVLEKLRSRPAVISVEMEGPDSYKSPFFAQINNWMQQNNYVLKHVTHIGDGINIPTDYIYVRHNGHA